MNKVYKISALWMMCLMLVSCFTLTACSNDDEDTNQYTGGIKLNVFGPCPVARGGELRFLGSGMDKVTGVLIPGCDEITDIKVISSTEIRVTVPQTAKEGLITLNTSKGQLTTTTKISFTEPVSFDAFTPGTIKPGETLTITGEYLNLIKEVIFPGDVVVKKFSTQTRKEIKVVVPPEALSGKVIISDGAEIPNWIYSKNELEIVLPSVHSVADLTGKKPGDAISITGQNLDLVTKIEMPDGTSVQFEVADNKLSFVLPEGITDGAIVMIPASGVKVAVANIGVAVPGNLKAVPAIDIKAGETVTVSGVNMELVTAVIFPGVEKAVKPSTKTATAITVEMPVAATSGDLVLNTASGKTASVAISTLKPSEVVYEQAAVAAGENVVLKGKHLDLVKSVTFGGNKIVEVSSSLPTELTVKVPVDADSGVVTLTMVNGESVKCGDLTVNKPNCCYIPVLPGNDTEIKAGTLLTVEVKNGDKLQNVQINNHTVQYILNGSILYISIPSDASDATKLTLKSSNGEITYTISVKGSTSSGKVIWEGNTVLGNWAANIMLSADLLTGAKVGQTIVVNVKDLEPSPGWWQIAFKDMGPGWPSIGNIMELTADATSCERVIDAAMLTAMETNGIVIAGCYNTVTKIELK